MDTDVHHAHFAWDLLDSAKRAITTQGVEPEVAAEPAPSQFSEPSSTEQERSMPMAEAPLIVGSKSPAMVTTPASEIQTEEMLTMLARPDPAPENTPPNQPGLLSARLPVMQGS